MEKLNIQSFADGKINSYYNGNIALFCDFQEVRNMETPSLLVEGLLFSVVTHGHIQISLDDKTYQLQEGDIVVCKPRSIFDKSMMSLDFNALMLFISPEYVSKLSQMIRLEWTFASFANSHKVLHADEMAMDRYHLYFDLLKNHLSRPDSPNKELSLRLLFASMAYDLQDLRDFQQAEALHQTYSSGENILRQFMQNLHDPSQPFLMVNQYAAMFSITPKYFSSVCKRLTGKTANQLISDEIVRSAQIALRDSSKSVKQIATLLGFKNQSHFGRFFRHQTGVSPQKYREGKAI